jgi:hypothetical protein
VGDHDENIGGIPREVGGYRIQRILGTGGMATVYAALQRHPRRTVAFKVMRADITSDMARRRFRREVEILGKLNHPNIAHVFDAGTFETAEGERPYFVMEYVDGARDIVAYIAEKLPSIDDRIKLFIKFCAAIEHGHRLRIIHRDIKPSNLLIGRNGQPKVIDFGVARATEVGESGQTMTEDGRLVGTVQYMAPEQVGGAMSDLDARCDVYALGAVLYKILTGKPVHELEGLPLFAAVQIIRDEATTKPGAHRADLRGDLETIMMKALAKDRRRRYASAGSFGRDLLRYLAKKPIHGRPVSKTYRARLFVVRHRVPIVAGTVALTVMGIAVGIVLWDRAQSARDVGDVDVVASETDAGRADVGDDTAAPTFAPTGVVPEATAPLPRVPDEPFTLEGATGGIVVLRYDIAHDMMIAGGSDGAITVWSLDTREVRFQAADHADRIRAIEVSRDGAVLASAGDDGQIALVSAEDGALIRRIESPAGLVDALALGTTGGDIAYAFGDLTVRLERAGSKARTVRGSHGNVLALDWRHDGAWIAGGTERGAVYIWTNDGALVDRNVPEVETRIVAIGFSAAGDALYAIDEAGDGRAWMIVDDELTSMRTFTLGRDRPTGITIDPDGQYALVRRDVSLQVFDLAQQKAVERGVTLGEALSAALHPAGTWIARGFADGYIEVDRIR